MITLQWYRQHINDRRYYRDTTNDDEKDNDHDAQEDTTDDTTADNMMVDVANKINDEIMQ